MIRETVLLLSVICAFIGLAFLVMWAVALPSPRTRSRLDGWRWSRRAVVKGLFLLLGGGAGTLALAPPHAPSVTAEPAISSSSLTEAPAPRTAANLKIEASSKAISKRSSGPIPTGVVAGRPPDGNEWGFWALIGALTIVLGVPIVAKVLQVIHLTFLTVLNVATAAFIMVPHAFADSFLGSHHRVTRLLKAIISGLERWNAWALEDERTPEQIAAQREQDQLFAMAAVANLAAEKVVKNLRAQRR